MHLSTSHQKETFLFMQIQVETFEKKTITKVKYNSEKQQHLFKSHKCIFLL